MLTGEMPLPWPASSSIPSNSLPQLVSKPLSGWFLITSDLAFFKLAASANVSHDTIDPCVFIFKDLFERGSRCEHIDRTRLVVARRRRPRSSRGLFSGGP